jgi:CIC family chloride channel protein
VSTASAWIQGLSRRFFYFWGASWKRFGYNHQCQQLAIITGKEQDIMVQLITVTDKNKPTSDLKQRKNIFPFLDRVHIPESMTIFLTAVVVGIGAGLGAVIFRKLIALSQDFFFGTLAGLMKGISPYYLLIIPALGGLIYGPIIYKFAREAKGHGVPEVMEAVALRGGRIRPRVAVVKSLASAICIASGGSIGREGPIAQIGSAIGSTVGQYLKLSDERIRNLVACGAAGGIAATFNAPIAGAIFALEVILGQMHAIYFGAVVISAVTADVVAHFFQGDMRAFSVPEYTLVSPWEFLLYVVLGILAAVAAVSFTRLLYLSEDLWDSLHFPEYLKPLLGGVVLGAIGLASSKIDGFPRVFGVGYESITDALVGNLTVQITLTLLVLKLLATITTLGAGGSGGIFAPSLFMGAMLGQVFGVVSNMLFPHITAPPGAYALVGMSAFFTGAAHAPLTSILILFELTGNYQIILPLMLATVTSIIIARAISPESIYTLKLTRRGVHLQEGTDLDVMQTITVGEAMSKKFEVVPNTMTLSDLAQEFERSHHHGFPVVDRDGKLCGVVTIQDLEKYTSKKDLANKTVADIATCDTVVVAYEDEPMWSALRKLGMRDVGRLPVVRRDNESQLVGIIRRKDIIQAYNLAIIQRSQHQAKLENQRLGKLIDSDLVQVVIPEKARVIGKRISEIKLPEECLIVSVHRGRKLFIAHGYTSLQAKDQVTVVSQEHTAEEIKNLLTEEA